MAEKKLKKVCKCEKCGNEAEMVITCSLEEKNDHAPVEAQPGTPSGMHSVKGRGVCSHCGNEADMWVDFEP